VTHADIQTMLAGYDAETLARWYVDLNQFLWPDDCPVPKPQGYDEAPRHCRSADVMDRYTLNGPLWRVIMQMSTAEDRSRAWWRLSLGRTETEWQEWWDNRPGDGVVDGYSLATC
jgi:hypothetical protein